MKGMNVTFDILNRLDGHAVVIDVHKCSINKHGDPSEYEPGDYVAVHIIDGDAGIEGQPETDNRTYSTMLLRKAEARAVASAIMGVAAEL